MLKPNWWPHPHPQLDATGQRRRPYITLSPRRTVAVTKGARVLKHAVTEPVRVNTYPVRPHPARRPFTTLQHTKTVLKPVFRRHRPERPDLVAIDNAVKNEHYHRDMSPRLVR